MRTDSGVRVRRRGRQAACGRRTTVALAAACLAFAAESAADAGERVRLRQVPVRSTQGGVHLHGGDDGAAYAHLYVEEGGTLWARRTRAGADGSVATADVAIDANGPFSSIVMDGSGASACLATWRVARVDPQGGITSSAGTVGRPHRAFLRDGAIGVLEERTGGAGRDLWGAEILRSDGTRVDVPDLGAVRRWRLPGGDPLPGLGGVTELRHGPLSIRPDDRGGFVVLFVAERWTGATRQADALTGVAVGADGTVTAVALPDLTSESDPPSLRHVDGTLVAGAGGTTWLLRHVVDTESGAHARTDVGLLQSGAPGVTRRIDVLGNAFPGGITRPRGDVSAQERVVLVGPEQVSRRDGSSAQHALRLVWRRFDAGAAGKVETRERVLAARLAATDGRRSTFEVRAFDVAVAPDGACVAAMITRTRPGARGRLLVWVVAPDGRVLRRVSRPVSGEFSVAAAACGDRGFAVLPVEDSGGERKLLHFLR